MGFLIFIFGVYLIFAEQIFFGVLSIILAFLIFPNRKSSGTHHSNYDYNNSSNDHVYSSDSDSSGGDSGGSSD
ncbi:hypothetical protein [Neobacillus niacini]|uniref:hypothetical protein n=1 Tax=Neobacillus niacini TaxID=86668 RepID=UPI000ACE866D|nr:hypothetical protein [Neobacillus niacini]